MGDARVTNVVPETGVSADSFPQDRFAICELTSPRTTFEQDVELCCEVGASGMSICEWKLRAGEEAAQAELLRERGLRAAICIPSAIAPLDLDQKYWPIQAPGSVDERLDAMRESLRRLAQFDPYTVVVATGRDPRRSAGDERRTVVAALQRLGEYADVLGLHLSLEPIRIGLFDLDFSIINGIEDAVELLDEVGAGNIGLCYDVYHLWDARDVIAATERCASRIRGVQLSDWRAPRSPMDRLIPGDGSIDLPGVLGALERGGYSGWFDIEVLSKDLSALPAEVVLARSRDGFERAWAQRH